MRRTGGAGRVVSRRKAGGFDFVKWFEAFRRAVMGTRSHRAGPERWPRPVAMMVREALSDVAPEQFLNALAASHMRHWARGRLPRHQQFWCRSEWGKVDLTFGVAERDPKREWSAKTWTALRRTTRGICEVKVVYAHYGKAKRSGMIENLAGQLGPGGAHLERYGIVWLYGHGDDPEQFAKAREHLVEAIAKKEQFLRDFASDTPNPMENRGQWPFRSFGRLDLALVERHSARGVVE